MHESDTCFARNDAEIASKVIDGEAILINLKDGTYYSMDGVAAEVWELLAGGSSVESATRRVVSRYGVDPERARADLDALFQRLAEERLVAATGAAKPQPPERDGDERGEREYRKPELHCYRDMADLLALDPPTPGILDHLMRQPAEES